MATFSDVKIEQLLQDAQLRKAAAHDEAELAKLGILRGGNSGCLTEEGEEYGKCSRVTLLRYLGVDAPTDDRSSFFFAAGHANEATWSELLKQVWPGPV